MKVFFVRHGQTQSNLEQHQYRAIKIKMYITSKKSRIIFKTIWFCMYYDNLKYNDKK